MCYSVTRNRMKKNNNLHIVYKSVGETPLEAISKFKTTNIEFSTSKITYAGRLDPMAEGLLLLLTNEEVGNKEKYIGLNKTYEFSILWGFSTDTLDLLGLVGETSLEVPDVSKIVESLKKNQGKFIQKYPAYSSKPVGGKPLFTWAREGKLNEIRIPEHDVEVFSSRYLKRQKYSFTELQKIISDKINTVSGDFRQKEISAKWDEVLEKRKENEFTVDSFEVEVSSGFYVRQFVSDLSERLGVKATTFFIKRTKIGEYTIAL